MNPDEKSPEPEYGYVVVDADQLLALCDRSAVTGKSVEELVQLAVARFIEERREEAINLAERKRS